MSHYYSTEQTTQVIISLLHQHGIRKVVASPGSANMALVASMQNDPFFEMYSSVDERSAAYMACGLAAQSGESVVLTCTGATASRNYMPGMTEAFYRKLPVLAITSTQAVSKIGHLVAQVIDRSILPNDVAKLSVTLPIVKTADDIWECEIKVNNAILELNRRGGGPSHINLPTTYAHQYNVRVLPSYRKIERVVPRGPFPDLPKGRIAVFVGSHDSWSEDSTQSLERFCECNNAIVICDHTSGYRGKYRVNYGLAGCQVLLDSKINLPDVLIHIGQVSGDYYGINIGGKAVWRVSPDGEIRDTFRKLTHVFEMDELSFFEYYTERNNSARNEYYSSCQSQLRQIRQKIPVLPFSNIWIASQLADKIPQNSVIHFGILNSLRAWNFFELSETITSSSNVGGFGIDGALSTTIGASFTNSEKLFYCVLGDLAFFYDMNSLGNRHIGKNLRILLVNNGKGTEFRQYGHVSSSFGDELDKFVAASGHFGKQSRSLVKHYAQDLGFEYLSASNMSEFELACPRFIDPEIGPKPLLFEVFTNSDNESSALFSMMNIHGDVRLKATHMAKSMANSLLGKKTMQALKSLIRS